ncbi:hypothetical protein D3C81_1150710 [compost metagenome]
MRGGQPQVGRYRRRSIGIGRGIDTGAAIEDVVASPGVDDVVEAVAGAVGSASRQQAQVLDVVAQGVGAEEAVDAIGAAGAGRGIGLADDIAGIVDVVEIGAIATDQAVGTGGAVELVAAQATAEGVGGRITGQLVVIGAAREVFEVQQGVCTGATGGLRGGQAQAGRYRRRGIGIGRGIDTGAAIEDVVAGCCIDDVIKAVTGAVGSAGRQQTQVLDIVTQGVGAEVAIDAIGATGAGDSIGFADDIADIVDVVDVRTIAASHPVGTAATIEGVVAGTAIEGVVVCAAVKDIGQGIAG